MGQIPFKESTIVGLSTFKSTVNSALAIKALGSFNFPRTISQLFAFSGEIRVIAWTTGLLVSADSRDIIDQKYILGAAATETTLLKVFSRKFLSS